MLIATLRKQALKQLVLQLLLLAASTPVVAGVRFDVTPTSDPSPDFRAYTVSLAGTDGSTLPAVLNVSLSGAHQIWQNPVAGALTFTPIDGDSGRGNYGNPNWNPFDTHLLVDPRPGGDNVVTSPGFGLSEANDGSNPRDLHAEFLEPPAPFESFLATAGIGIFSFTGPDATIAWINPQPVQVDLIRVVLPCSRCAKLSMDLIDPRSGGGFIEVRDYVIGGDPNLPSVVSDVNSLTFVGDAVNLRPSATNCPESWSELLNPRYTPAAGVPSGAPGANLQPQWNPATQAFNWDTTGSSPGLYTWQVAATSPAGADQGLITVQVTVPEPNVWILVITFVVSFYSHRHGRIAFGRVSGKAK